MADIEERLSLVELQVHEVREDLGVLRTLVQHDHASALNKIRYVTEKILHGLCKRNTISWGKAEPTLERMIGPLLANGVIPKNVGIHVRTIQANTSPGSHFQEHALGDSHVQISQMALLDFLEWYAGFEPAPGTRASSPDAPAADEGGPPWATIAAIAAAVGIPVVPLLFVVHSAPAGPIEKVIPVLIGVGVLAGAVAAFTGAIAAMGSKKRIGVAAAVAGVFEIVAALWTL